MLKSIQEKIYAGERITADQALYLYNYADLLELGKLATHVRTSKAPTGHENSVWWNMNLHLNPTNVCIAGCNFCAFARLPNEEGAYTMTLDQALERARNGASNGAREVHIVGGLNPKAILPYYTNLLRAIKSELPQLHIKAFTAVEIAFFAQLSKMTYKEVIEELVKAGLDSMPGGGAEIFARSVRDDTCPDKVYADDWLEIHGIAHSLGLKTNATMLAGIGEGPEERIDHMIRLREQQDKSGGFQTFIPLSCHYEDTDIADQVEHITGIDQIKNIAISRLILDNFDHIKAYWVQLGHSIAQIALHFGADDLDGTVVDERITNAAGAERKGTAQMELQRLITNAGYTPVERTTTYEIVS